MGLILKVLDSVISELAVLSLSVGKGSEILSFLCTESHVVLNKKGEIKVFSLADISALRYLAIPNVGNSEITLVPLK